MAEQDHDDGYQGPATLETGGSRLDVQVQLRGHFEPIDGRYHWYGRIETHDGLDELLGSARASGVLTTPGGSAPCELSDPDPWRRYRVTGISTPPYATPSPDSVLAAEAGAARPGADENLNAAEPGPARPGAAGTSAKAGGAPPAPRPLPGHVRVAVIGAGFGGLGAAIRLRRAGYTDFVVLERAGTVGGTWRDNS